MSKKEQKRLQREAEKEKAESEAIQGLTRAIEELESGRKKPEELDGIIAEAKTLAQQWKNPHSAKHPKDRRPLFDGTTGERTFLLVGLVVCLMREHTFLELIRSFFPSELEKLGRDSSEILAGILASMQPQPTRTRKYERTRSKAHRGAVGLIEKQFGQPQLAWWRTASEWMPLPISPPSEPTCLDDIFAGRAVNMLRLQKLFGMDRHRLKFQGKKSGRTTLYDYHAVVTIMKILLSERPPKKRKRRGRSPVLWLSDPRDPDLRARVLSQIEARIKSIPVRDEIAMVFLAVVHRYHPDSGKK